MKIADVLLAGYDHEVENTRRILALVPSGKDDYAPHEKSMKLSKLAEHTARLAEFGLLCMSNNDLDVATVKWATAKLENAGQLVAVLQESSAKLKEAVAAMSDEQLEESFTLRFGEHALASLPKHLAFKTMYMHHLVHHRAQLGAYLRNLNIPIPGLYGPSADEPFKG